ncbi:Rieske (2Fe-2S) protein [Noviherbaspirillum sedimenti]|uniref:Rieske (2Fe-2S) protein n=1 Tax=Noviherbaspirillum sedimenti TaxID=2320865 RepID=A0A3A3GHV3_9BURK|nr:Rieske (2Fe-2S) protein [Noviherbaspirillum sedimenti]RJG01846.1 Rieske (2Fe-2S) protein [Noviherbaspirillum sedimenti]
MKPMQRVGSLKELKDGKPLDVTLDGQKIAVFYIKDEVVATSGKCPHAGGPIQCGDLEGAWLTCPWHGWTFDLNSGVCTDDPSLALDIYPVRVDGDDILVAV